MYRFIAFMWDRHTAELSTIAKTLVRRLRASSSDWECVLDADGMCVLHASGKPRSYQTYVLGEDVGVILGNLFGRHVTGNDQARQATLDSHEVVKIQRTHGRYLVENYWGRYIAFLRQRNGSIASILRDPTGAMPCLLTKVDEIDVACSNIDDCSFLDLSPRVINWDHVVSYLWYDRIITSETGLQGIRQVQAGECVSLDTHGTKETFYWNPAEICQSRTVENHRDAKQELKSVIEFCVHSWASCYRSILHELSGGLDSSVVLSCLSNAPNNVKVICQNYFTETAGGDERHYARKAASHAQINLIETPLNALARALDSMFDSTKVASPVLVNMIPASHLVRERQARRHGVEAIFSGQGGDHFFQRGRTRLIAADYARRHGLRPEILKIVLDTARFTGQSVWTVAAGVLASGLLRWREDPYDQIGPPPLLSSASRDILDPARIRHYWVDNAFNIPNGKRLAIFGLVDTQKFYHVSCRYADIVHPIISQPVIEVCLQIPSYVLTYGGIDRALVREAFGDAVPREIVTRTAKSNTTPYFHALLAENLPFLRECLLDGLLMDAGVLDAANTETSLRESALLRDPHLISAILNALRAEIWLRTWMPGNRRVAA